MTHIEELAQNTPKTRRRMRAMGATSVADAQARATLNERSESVTYRMMRDAVRGPESDDQRAAGVWLQKRGYKVA
jgi:hypothetical protein